MYRQVDVHYSNQTVMFYSQCGNLRLHHPGEASSLRLARVLHAADKVGLLETRCSGPYYLGVLYKVWSVNAKRPSTL